MILCPHCNERIDFVQSVGLTRRQSEVLEAYLAFSEEGSPPTVRDLAGYLLSSVSSVHRMLKIIESRGLITKQPGLARPISTADRSVAA